MPPVTTELSVLELYLYTYNVGLNSIVGVLCIIHIHVSGINRGTMRHLPQSEGLRPPVTYDVGLFNLKITSGDQSLPSRT